MKISIPTTHEYSPFYADYIERATKRGDVEAALSSQMEELQAALDALTDTQARFKPGPQEWSIKEVIGHINDVERVFSYRLLRISRNDATPTVKSSTFWAFWKSIRRASFYVAVRKTLTGWRARSRSSRLILSYSALLN